MILPGANLGCKIKVKSWKSKSFGKRRVRLCGNARSAAQKMDHYVVFSVRSVGKRDRAGELLNSSCMK